MSENEPLVEQLARFLRTLFASTETELLNALAEYDLSFTQIRVAMLLNALDDAVPINEIAAQVDLSMTTVGRAIDQLVERGLIERRESPDDRRVRLVTLTGAGRDVLDNNFRARHDALRAFVRRLPPQHVAALAAALDPILADDYIHSRPADPNGPATRPAPTQRTR